MEVNNLMGAGESRPDVCCAHIASPRQIAIAVNSARSRLTAALRSNQQGARHMIGLLSRDSNSTGNRSSASPHRPHPSPHRLHRCALSVQEATDLEMLSILQPPRPCCARIDSSAYHIRTCIRVVQMEPARVAQSRLHGPARAAQPVRSQSSRTGVYPHGPAHETPLSTLYYSPHGPAPIAARVVLFAAGTSTAVGCVVRTGSVQWSRI
jgi:hypothetical protein